MYYDEAGSGGLAEVLIEGDIQSRQDFVKFVQAMEKDLLAYPDGWENPTLESFLEAMSRWVEDNGLAAAQQSNDEPPPPEPNWNQLARILYAARYYE